MSNQISAWCADEQKHINSMNYLFDINEYLNSNWATL